MSSKAPVSAPVSQPPAAPEHPALDAFLDKHFRQIAIAFGVLVVLAAAYGAFRYHNLQEAEAAAVLATQAKTVDDCDIVVQKYPGTAAAGDATLTKAKLLWDQNKKDTSVATLRDFVAKYPDHPFHAQGLISLGSRLEAQGGAAQLAEAKKAYETVVADPGKSGLGGFAQLRLADMLWNEGKQDEAKKAYEALPPKLTGSPFFDMNEERLKWLAAGLPTKEVDPPKPPPDSLKAATPATPVPPTKDEMFISSLVKGIPAADPTVLKPRPTPPPPPRPGRPKAANRPIAIPSPGKPGLATPGAGIAIPNNGKPGAMPTITIPPPVKAPTSATSPAVPVPAPAPKPVVVPAPAPAAATPAPTATSPAPAPAAPVVTPAPAPAAATPAAAPAPAAPSATPAPAPAATPAPAPAATAPAPAPAPAPDKK